MDQDTDDLAITLHTGNISPDAHLSVTILPFLGGVDEGAFLGAVPSRPKEEGNM